MLYRSARLAGENQLRGECSPRQAAVKSSYSGESASLASGTRVREGLRRVREYIDGEGTVKRDVNMEHDERIGTSLS